MTYMMFETLLFVLSKHRSTNGLFHYFEHRQWFQEYRDPSGYRIPFDVWRNETMIYPRHIIVFSQLLLPNRGSIEYKQNHIFITSDTEQSYISMTPHEYIYNLCKTKNTTRDLMEYLNDFYYSELRLHESEPPLYRIDAATWFDLFQMDFNEIRMLNSTFLTGSIEITGYEIVIRV